VRRVLHPAQHIIRHLGNHLSWYWWR